MQADFNRPVLAVDTGTSYLSLALRADGEIRLFHQEVGIRQSELILPEIRTLFRNAGITAADLGAIVYAKVPARLPDCVSASAWRKVWQRRSTRL